MPIPIMIKCRMLMLCFLFFVALQPGTYCQFKENIGERNRVYQELSSSTAGLGRSIFLEKIREKDLLDLYLFNKSYETGIEEFARFKTELHHAASASDIPKGVSPLSYLLHIIHLYGEEGGNNMAFLYYDGVKKLEDDEYEISSPFQPSNSPEHLEPKDNPKFIRIWYISSNYLFHLKVNTSYGQLMRLEETSRFSLGVSLLGNNGFSRGVVVDAARRTNEAPGKDIFKLIGSILLPPPILHLLNLDSINRVTIIPYNVIGQIPFYRLPVSDQDSSLFVDKYAYTIAPHLCNFYKVIAANRAHFGKKNFLQTENPVVVGNPKFYSDRKLSLPDLPGSEIEAKLAAALLNTTALTGADANYDRVVSQLRSADFAYFATHAVPSFDDPVGSSFLALSPSASNPKGYMTIKNIQRIMTGKTKIAILSACQTGVGRIYRNAYSSIGRGFFIAGVDNCIMSLWDLNDYDIIGFMKILIQELKTPQYFYPAENLRQAILKFRRINPDKLWSSMVNFGICY